MSHASIDTTLITHCPLPIDQQPRITKGNSVVNIDIEVVMMGWRLVWQMSTVVSACPFSVG